ncbi:MAG: TorF family putative porin [Gammaproteobacteria bacterium]
MKKIIAAASAVALTGLMSTGSVAGDFTANASFSNNYLWRGLTQTENEPVISGGIDYAHESGFYVGTWVANVEYGAGDRFSYEHDIYLGYAGEYNGFSYDIGWLYYNYDESAEYDFSEIYASVGYAGFSVTAWILAHSERDPTADPTYDFGFGDAFYLQADYGYEIRDGLELGLHVGYHDGDWVDEFNFADGTTDYVDYNVSLSKGGFSFVVSGTDLSDSPTGLQNDEVKYVISYTIDLDL